MQKDDRVEWVSQSRGSTKRKQGRIEFVIPHGCSAKEYIWNAGEPRRHESYIVRVSGPRGGSKLYWPAVKNLRKIETV